MRCRPWHHFLFRTIRQDPGVPVIYGKGLDSRPAMDVGSQLHRWGVVGIFPNDADGVRLVRGILVGQTDEWATQGARSKTLEPSACPQRAPERRGWTRLHPTRESSLPAARAALAPGPPEALRLNRRERPCTPRPCPPRPPRTAASRARASTATGRCRCGRRGNARGSPQPRRTARRPPPLSGSSGRA